MSDVPFTADRNFGLLAIPQHGKPSEYNVSTGQAGIDTGVRQLVSGEIWAQVIVPITGWTIASYLDEIVNPNPPPAILLPNNIPGNWNLIFQDEFNGNALDLTKWRPNWLAGDDTSDSPPVNSSEIEAYAPSQVSVNNGNLVLTATKKNVTVNGRKYTYVSGAVESHGKYDFTYGAVEASIKTPSGVGVWPAFWMDGANWPVTGEIDILEAYGTDGSSSFHYHYGTSAQNYGPGGSSGVAGASTVFHTYAVNWEPGIITWYYDGIMVYQLPNAHLVAGNTITSSPLFIILDLGLQKGFAGSSAAMEVDYVRVWQPSS